MITTATGMHVRLVESLDEANGWAVVFGYGSPERRAVPHHVRLSDLRSEGGLEEIRKVALSLRDRQREQPGTVDPLNHAEGTHCV